MLDRIEIDTLATAQDVSALDFSHAALSDQAIAYLGIQRTKQISRKSRAAWMEGDPAPMLEEARARREDIFNGALQEICCEYIPVQQQLATIGFAPTSVIDIGCGQALPDLFLHADFKPRFTLVDIEQTDAQYHFWAAEGSGYASLDDARALLKENGVAATKIKTINPRKTPRKMDGVTGDMLISFYSCGFHYPIDDYADLMVETVRNGGVVVLDLRKKYLRRKPDPLARLLGAGNAVELYEDPRSFRYMIVG